MLQKKKLTDVTLVVVLYGNKKVTRISTMIAIVKTLMKFDFDEVLYISSEPPFFQIRKMTWKKTEVINGFEDYNRFMLFSLGEFISTSHALCIQHDGFPVSPDVWDYRFRDWDYIGAPWPISKDGVTYTDEKGNSCRVGNGGFSFRSKFLLKLPNKLGLKFDTIHGSIHEDGILCCKWKQVLEDNGVKFAPVNIAAKFSTEEVIEGVTVNRSFGFHGLKYMKRNMFFHFLISRFKL